jgi:hypothetical protein
MSAGEGKNWKIFRIEDMSTIRSIFPDGEADERNWLLCSTSGIHGSYTKMDEIARSWDVPKEDVERHVGHRLTVLVIHPRIVSMGYGDIKIQKEDIPYLMQLVQSSVRQIAQSQDGNMPLFEPCSIGNAVGPPLPPRK